MQLTDAGVGELFVKKNVKQDDYEFYEREITLHRCLKS